MKLRLSPVALCALTLTTGLWLQTVRPVRAEGESLAPAVLKKVKAATVHLDVSLPTGGSVEGSGFFTDEPGVILTNAHVLGMLDADSRPPSKIQVTMDSGEVNSRTLPAKFVGVDRGSDLALIRVEGKDLPGAITVVPAKDLSETEAVFIFGFPLGKRLGKNITVSRSSVSSLRKQGGVLTQIQVNGGIHPGNSGGPVVNAKGEVVGVSVSAIQGTTLHFAIPGETVQGFLQGKLVSASIDLGWTEGKGVRMPYRLTAVDPLKRIKKITVETWTAPFNPKRPPSVPGKAQPGDSEHKTVEVKYEYQPVTSIELELPPLTPGKRYYIQPSYIDGKGTLQWRNAFAPALGAPLERKEATVKYAPRPGRKQPVELLTEGSFRVRVGGAEHTLSLNAKSTMVEESPANRDGDRLTLGMRYRAYSIAIKEDGKVLQDDDVKQALRSLGKVAVSLEMGADGAVVNSKGDLATAPPSAKKILESLNDQVLQGLELVTVPLPPGGMKPKQTWNVQRTILLGVPQVGLGVQGVADIQYTYLGARLLGKREIAFLVVKGQIKGLRGAPLGVVGKVGGAAQVALDTGEVLSSTMDFKAEADLELKRGGKAKLYGTLRANVKRDFPPPPAPKGKKD